MVEEVSRAVDFTLSWHKNKTNQNKIFGLEDNSEQIYDGNDEQITNLDDNDLPAVDDERREETKNFLADSFFGSPRHLKKQALNALAVVSEVGRQTLFITLTCNTN
jgi:hypothetical protein